MNDKTTRPRWPALGMVCLLPLLVGCDKHEAALKKLMQPLLKAQGLALPDLVSVTSAPLMDPGTAPYIEAIRNGSTWHVHPQGQAGTPCRNEEEIQKAVRSLRAHHADQKLLISAGVHTPFREIRTMVRGAAAAGFSRVDFLVSTPSRKTGNHTLPLDLIAASGTPWKIEPMLVSIDARGHIWTGHGPDRTLMDTNPSDHALPKLDHTLALYSTAAQAARCQAHCMIHVDDNAPYQRFLDVWSRFHDHGIARIFFTDLTDHPGITCQGMNFDHQERMELLKHKPLPTPPPPPLRPRL